MRREKEARLGPIASEEGLSLDMTRWFELAYLFPDLSFSGASLSESALFFIPLI
jgi:hypothetical protein